MSKAGCTLVFGGQVGSEGKGAIVGYLARRQEWDAAVNTFMTNAGHTWIGDDGEKVMVQQLPMAVVSESVGLLLIAAGSAITESTLMHEIDDLESRGYTVVDRLRIHPRAMIIEDVDVKYEQKATKYLGSTSKGCGRALARKAMRSNGVMAHPVKLARDVQWLKPFIADTTEICNGIVNNGGSILVEGSQGFDLDINHGIEYPYCTSRGTTPMQVMADIGVSERACAEVIAVLRSYPIRVGNVVESGQQVGYSGPFGGRELTWAEITDRSGSPTPLEERTTVTQRVRRIFEMDFARLKYMVNVCRPHTFALTFADYISYDLRGKTLADFPPVDGSYSTSFPKQLSDFLDELDKLGPLTEMVKTGPRDSDMIDFGARQFSAR